MCKLFFADSPYTPMLSKGVLALQEDGTLQRLKVKWWKEKVQSAGGEVCDVSLLYP